MASCAKCGAELEGPRCLNCDTGAADDPDQRPDSPWIEVWFGEPKWRLVVEKALADAGVVAASPAEMTDWARAYVGPDLTMPVWVRATDAARAREALDALRARIPDAFPEGTL